MESNKHNFSTEEEEFFSNVMLPNETLLWSHKSSMATESKVVICFSLIFSLFMLIMAVIVGYVAPGIRIFVIPGFSIVVVWLIVYAVWTFLARNGTYINLLTNYRVIQGYHKHNKIVRTSSIPYGVLDIIECAPEKNTIQFTSNVFVGSNNDVEMKPGFKDPRNDRYASIFFNNVENTEEVERIAREQHMMMAPISNDAKQKREETSSFTNPQQSASNYLSWPKPYRDLMEMALNYTDSTSLVDEASEGEKEIVLWTYRPSALTLWRNPLLILIFGEITLAVFAGIIQNGIVFLVGSLILLFAVIFSWSATYLLRHAYAITTKGLLIFRTGRPRPYPRPPDFILSDGSNHVLRVKYEKLFPLITTLDAKKGSGEVYIPTQQTANVKVYVDDLRSFFGLLVEGYEFRMTHK